MRQSRWSDDDIRAIHERYIAGESTASIYKSGGPCPEALRLRLIGLGLSVRPVGGQPAPLVGRFWGRVVRAESGCWSWTGWANAFGYGGIYSHEKRGTVLAHRLSWTIHNGPIPGGMFVLHRCDNPPCTNPEHLWLGTRGDNIRDAAAKGRHQHGATHAHAKLSDEEVTAIRVSAEPPAAVAPRYGISAANVLHIRKRETWKHIA